MECWKEDIVIIGAGAAGLTAALRLKEKGIGACVFDRSEDIGGSAHGGSGRGPAEAMPSLAYIKMCMEDVRIKSIGQFACCGKEFGPAGLEKGQKPNIMGPGSIQDPEYYETAEGTVQGLQSRRAGPMRWLPAHWQDTLKTQKQRNFNPIPPARSNPWKWQLQIPATCPYM